MHLDAVHPEYQSRPANGWFQKGQKVAIKTTASGIVASGSTFTLRLISKTAICPLSRPTRSTLCPFGNC